MKTFLVIISLNLLFNLIYTNNVFGNDFKDCTDFKEDCFKIENSPHQSFYMKGTDHNKVAVLVHGLSDSPYFTKDIALLLNSQGYYIYSVLLTGHGLSPEALMHVSSSQWINDIKKTIDQALSDTGSHQVVLSGFSMGGVLVTALAEDSKWENKISKLILLAPAFQIKKDSGRMICATGAYHLKTWASDSPGSTPVKYKQLPFNAVCELVDMSAIVRELAKFVTAPVFMAVSDYDQTINTTVAIETYLQMNSSQNKLFFIKNMKTSHTDIIFRSDYIGKKKNPLFKQMSEQIIQFLDE